MMELIDPTGELEPIERRPAPRLDTLEGSVLGLVDISKPRGDVFLDRLHQLLTEQGATIRRYAKPTHAKPAPLDLRALIAEECEAVVEALAD